MSSNDQFFESLAGLLPQGYAWPRDPHSVWMSVVRSEADELAQYTADVHAMVAQWQPHTAVARLAEWEAATGLPDPCFGSAQTEGQRRQQVLMRLRGVDLLLDDSSHAAPGVIEASCASIGYDDVEARYNTPMRAGARLGRRLGALDGRLYVLAAVGSKPLRCGQRVGSRLVTRVGAGPELACHLDRIVPARFSINVIFR